MKQRVPEQTPTFAEAEKSLCAALTALSDRAAMQAFLHDLCTPAELEAMVDRWRVVPYLQQGVSYREIHRLTGVSITTVGRVARFLKDGNGGYMRAIRAIEQLGKDQG